MFKKKSNKICITASLYLVMGFYAQQALQNRLTGPDRRLSYEAYMQISAYVKLVQKDKDTIRQLRQTCMDDI